MAPTPGKCRRFPLRGKKIYMHYETGARPSKSLEKILRALGASISQFFDRKIDCVITNLPQDRWPLQPTLSPRCSSKENVDPRSENSPKMSTGNHPSPSLQNSPLGVTRGRAMLLAVKKTSKPSTASSAIDQSVPGTRHPHDVLLRAQEFGIKVLTIDVVRKWIRALPEDVEIQLEIGESPFFDSGTTSEPDDPERDRLWLLRPLAHPCIKIVDLKVRTRPSYMEKTNYMECLWRPFLDSPSTATTSLKTPALSNAPQTPTTPAGTSTTPQASVGLPPSTNVVTSQRTTGLSKRDLGAKNSPGVSLVRSSHKGFSSSKRRKLSNKRSRGTHAEPSGYCECCLSHFNNLYTHVTGTCHMNYAENAENFRQLDQLLSELPSMREALAKARGVKIRSIAPPPDANAPASPNRQIQETSPQPTHAAHEPIDDIVMDFSALPPLPTPSVPQNPVVGNSSASQLFSESGERSNITIVGDLPSSLIVGEASPTFHPVSINVPATCSTLFPPLAMSSSVTPAQDVEQTVTTPLLRGVAGGALAQPETTVNLPFESAFPPLHLLNEPPNLHATPPISQAPILREVAPTMTSMGSAMAPPRIGTCTVQEIISSIVISSPPKDPAAAPSLPSPRRDTSPVLKKRFRKCTECQCMHVPTEVPIQLRLQCGGASPDRTRDTQARPLPPPCSQFLSPQRSRVQPNKRTRVIAQKAKSKPSFPCGVCGSNVNYKVWSVLCSTCGLWVHANCSKMNLAQIRKLPQSHSWICPTCHVH
ncbi:Hsk1-interacting molecule 1 [Taenia solium]|eukprot:TsM_000486000 transcript=TsM_000486000 gene=TsM_000486000